MVTKFEFRNYWNNYHLIIHIKKHAYTGNTPAADIVIQLDMCRKYSFSIVCKLNNVIATMR